MVAPLILGMIPTAMKLAADFAPSIAGWLGGDKAESVAEEVVNIAQSITGTDSPDQAMEVLKKDPQLALKYQQAMMDYQLALEREETKRMGMQIEHMNQVNETMQVEVREGKGWKAGWRPFNGYLFGATIFCDYFLSQIALALFGVIVKIWAHPTAAISFEWTHIPDGVYIFWSGILGVSAVSRGVEKIRKTQAFAGQSPAGNGLGGMVKDFAKGVMGRK